MFVCLPKPSCSVIGLIPGFFSETGTDTGVDSGDAKVRMHTVHCTGSKDRVKRCRDGQQIPTRCISDDRDRPLMRVKSTYLDSAVLSSRDLSTTDPQSKLELARCIAKEKRRQRQSGRQTMQQTQNCVVSC